MSISEALKEELKNPLPGLDFQLRMAPDHRRFDHLRGKSVTDAAVSLIILNTGEKKPEMLLMKRTEYEGYHSGQVCFPGGKKDETDVNLLQCAIRETREELGIHLEQTSCLGELSPVDIPVSGFRVFPYVFYVHKAVDTRLNPDEVSYLIRFPLRILLDEAIIRIHPFTFDTLHFEAPYFDIEDEIVWGATSMILSEFTEILRRVDKKNPGLL